MVTTVSHNRQAIDAPAVRPPAYSLLIAAEANSDGVVWQQGVEWAPEQFAGGVAIGLDCLGSKPDLPDADLGANPMRNTAEPFVVVAHDRCSTFGFAARDYEGRARRQLAAVQSFLVAREFQLGTLRDALGLDNVALVDAIEVTPSLVAPPLALAEIEGAVAEAYQGKRAMLHVTAQMLTLMHLNNGLIQSGQKWLTPMGNVVAADAGYTAVGGHEWIYATTLPTIRLSEVIIIPGSFPEAMAQATRRSDNTVEIFAERLALVQLDSSDDSLADEMFKVEVDTAPFAFAS